MHAQFFFISGIYILPPDFLFTETEIHLFTWDKIIKSDSSIVTCTFSIRYTSEIKSVLHWCKPSYCFFKLFYFMLMCFGRCNLRQGGINTIFNVRFQSEITFSLSYITRLLLILEVQTCDHEIESWKRLICITCNTPLFMAHWSRFMQFPCDNLRR